MTAHEIHALSGAYAMDALDDFERARFEAHLAACAECRAEVASLQDAAATLSTVTAVAPPAAMRAKILADIKTVRPLPPVVARIEARRPRRWTNLVAAAAVLGVLGGGAVVWNDVTGSNSSQPPSATDAIRLASDVQFVSTKLPQGARVDLYRSLKENGAVIVTHNMPDAPNGRVYQLWLQNAAGKMISAGLMQSGGNRAVLLKGDAARSTGAGITVEPAGGSTEPTTAPVALLDFDQAT